MSFLNLMKNRLKPRDVDEALTKAVESVLPDVESTDEGKVLTVNSSGEWDAENLPNQLPDVESTDEGKILTVDSSGEWVAGNPPSSGGYDITANEVDTGKKFNGSPIYVRTLPAPFKDYMSGQVLNLIPKPDYVSKIISFTVYVDAAIAPVIVPDTFVDNGNIKIIPNIATSGTATCVIEYTKTVVTNKKKTK